VSRPDAGRPRGADACIAALRRAGVDTVFALSGNQIMPLFDALIESGISVVHTRHEGAAVYMAEARAQLTGRAGVALLTAGPGFANGLSALYSARASETPVLVLSGDAPSGQAGDGAFQEMPQSAIAGPLAKASRTAETADSIGAETARALALAEAGRPGPVHLALPFDLLNRPVEAGPPEPAPEPSPPHADALAACLDHLRRAERPIILTGPALARAHARPLLDRLAAAVGAPVIAMESPRGLNDPNLGAFAEALAEADSLLLLGKPVDFQLGFARPPALPETCRILQIDPDPAILGRSRRMLGDRLTLALEAPAGTAAQGLIAASAGVGAGAGNGAGAGSGGREAWREKVETAIRHRPAGWAAIRSGSDGPLHPLEVCRAVQTVLDADPGAVLVVDGGEFGQWAQACLSAPQRVINGPSGAIGGAIPYAVAASLARPDATVIALLGDGTAGFYLAELDTALRHGARFVAVIGNDARWNAEHQIQLRSYGPERLLGCELLPTRYDEAATGLGCHGAYVTRADELPKALERGLRSGLPACLNVMIESHPAPSLGRNAK